MSADVSYLPCGCAMPSHCDDGEALPEWERDLLHRQNCPKRVQMVEMECSPLRAALIAIFSMHMPAPDPLPGDPFHIGCSCGSALYMGHMPTLIEGRVARLMREGDL